ncbi:MAG: HI0074 family nucleotidyltransferase substrate-binding subunit [Patescibacteria group bacterium]
MTKSDSLKEDYLKTLENLEKILKLEKNQINRDAAIKRFELCFDVAWKFIKSILEEKDIICNSPNDCFKQAYMQKLIEYSDSWIKMTKVRNEAVHTYKDELAENLYKELPEYLKIFQELKEKIK